MVSHIGRKIRSKDRFIAIYLSSIIFLAEIYYCDSAFVSRFAIWRNRAFLGIPRLQGDTHALPTFLEVHWPEFSIGLPLNDSVVWHSISESYVGISNNLRSVGGLEVDIRGRLWILDNPEPGGTDQSARIIVYDLKRNDRQVAHVELKGVPTERLNILVVDSTTDPWENRAYIGDLGDESIVTYSLEYQRWWKIKLVRNSGVPPVFSTDLAISRKNARLYFTGYSTQDLFSVDLNDLRQDIGNLGETRNVTISWLGTKMGFSSGLLCDAKTGLHYFLDSEIASVRWDTRLPLRAESHSVLLQNEDITCITDYKMDHQKNVWGLIDMACRATNMSTASNDLASRLRVVRIAKYRYGS